MFRKIGPFILLFLVALSVSTVLAESSFEFQMGDAKDFLSIALSIRPIPTVNPIATGNWTGWNRYTDGQTLSAPAVAVYGDRLCIMARGTDN